MFFQVEILPADEHLGELPVALALGLQARRQRVPLLHERARRLAPWRRSRDGGGHIKKRSLLDHLNYWSRSTISITFKFWRLTPWSVKVHNAKVLGLTQHSSVILHNLFFTKIILCPVHSVLLSCKWGVVLLWKWKWSAYKVQGCYIYKICISKSPCCNCFVFTSSRPTVATHDEITTVTVTWVRISESWLRFERFESES